jgi:uncharacterized protein YggU (UPF0235/DUF167 family)
MTVVGRHGLARTAPGSVDQPYSPTPTGITLHLRVTPNAAADRIEGSERRDDGSVVLRVRVRAVPDKGQANTAVEALIAREFGVGKRAVSVVAGHAARLKTVAVVGDSAALLVVAERLVGRV